MGRRKKESAGPSGPPGAPEWVVTFTDMISLLVTFFVLLMTFSSLEEFDVLKVEAILTGNLGSFDARSFNPITLQDDVLAATDIMRGAARPHTRPPEELAESLDEMGQRQDDEHVSLDLSQLRDGLAIEFGPEASFLPGSAEVVPALAKSLGEIGRILEHYPYLVVVEGFTDSAFQPTPTYPDADAMALARAAAAADVMLAQSGLPPSLVQLASQADRKPRADESSAEGRRDNRRVQIRVLSLSRLRADHLASLRKEPGGGR